LLIRESQKFPTFRIAVVKEGIARVTSQYDPRGSQTEKTYFGVDDRPTIPKGGIGATEQFSHRDEGATPSALSYFDERDNIIPVEVEVEQIVPNSVAQQIGLSPTDRLLSYADEELHSIQQFIYLTRQPGETLHKLVYLRAEETYTVEIPPVASARQFIVSASVRVTSPVSPGSEGR
jgi:hypothetical protein